MGAKIRASNGFPMVYSASDHRQPVPCRNARIAPRASDFHTSILLIDVGCQMNSAPDPALVDQAWRGYDPRAAVPLLLLAAAITAALLAGRFLFNEFLSAVLTYLLVLVIWPALLFVAAYRSVTYTYRLTDRALLVDRGFLHRPVPPLPYGDIAKIEHGASPVYSWLGVGWVVVSMSDGREVKLRSLRNPRDFAAALEERRSRKPPAA